jgi:hypothetical protein
MTGQEDDQYIHRPSLHTFMLELYTPLDPGPLLSFLVLPSLRSLSVRILGREPLRTRHWPYLGELVGRSGCGAVLEELDLCGLLIDESTPGATTQNWRDWGLTRKSQLRSDLEKMTGLRRLTLRHSTVGDDVFEDMGLGMHDMEVADDEQATKACPILPRLTHLHLQHCNFFSVDALVGMLVARNATVSLHAQWHHVTAYHITQEALLFRPSEDQHDDTASRPVPLKYLLIDNCTQLRVGHCALIHSIAKAGANLVDDQNALNARLFFYDETGRERYEMAPSGGSARPRTPGMEP